ncbi:MAG TPA: GNAT family N-acetyltransferase [Pyrinomonadaceae bacterium]|nr:GNAT family N-acetyltransferase [Pyrinomonadaceae bacterium]
MAQLTNRKRAAAATPAGPVPLAFPLTEKHDEREVLDFLAERPVPTVVMSGLIRDNGLESPFNRGTFYACRGAAGRLEGVALIGHAVFVDARSLGALKSFAELAQGHQSAHVILGEQDVVGSFWEYYAPAGQPARRFCRELLFEQRWPVPASEPVRGLRPAALDDLALVMPIHAAMAFEESGVDPLDVDPQGFRMRCARRIASERVWVLVEDGELVFKADIAADTPECVYVEGVYVAPESRRRRYGLHCLTQLGRHLLARAKVVCALVNEENPAAQALFFKAGYKLRGYYDTVYLRRRGAEAAGA